MTPDSQPEPARLAQQTHALLEWWRYYSELYLDGEMRRPVVRITDGMGALGEWRRDSREIRIAWSHVQNDPWHEVMETLRHEMAHQYVDEVFRIHHQPPHGPAFRQACRLLRVDPTATASPDSPARDEEERLTRRVSKLLALAGSPNEAEASAAMQKARELMLAHNIDVMRSDDRRFSYRELGAVKKRHMAWEATLGSILSEFFFVDVIWQPSYDARQLRDGTAMYVYGTPANVDMADYVYRYLGHVLEELWQDCRRRGGSTAGGRTQFFDGALQGFRARLRDSEQERTARPNALIWRGDAAAEAFVSWHVPNVRTRTRGSRRVGEAWHEGQRAGREISIRKPIEGGTTNRGRALPDT